MMTGHTHSFSHLFWGYSLAILLSLMGYQGGTAQPINNLVGDVVLPSPEAAASGQYADLPVGHVTGTPSISIPLQGIDEGKLSLPITLDYHASGIKVSQMSSWVGLGWSLNAGGSITRTAMDVHDEEFYGFFGGTISSSDAGAFCTDENFADEVDTEPDIFVINLPSLRAKFFIDKGKKIQLVDRTKQMKIELVENVNQVTFAGFIVTTPEGTRYIFGQDNAITARVTTEVNSNIDKHITEWKLLKIETYDGADQIYFQYTPETYSYKSLSSCVKQFGSLVSCLGSTGMDVINNNSYKYNVQSVTGCRLTSITTGSQTKSLLFQADTIRTDLGSTAYRLDHLEYTTGQYCKQYDFGYSYFTDPDAISFPYGKRLKLDRVTEISCDGTEVVEPYVFDYDAPLNQDGSHFMPHRLSRRIDHHGYYNGKIGNDNLEVLVPSTKLFVGAGFQSYGCADRSADMDKMKYGILTEIMYPHKGTRTMIYEPHSASGVDVESSISELIDGESTCGTVGPDCCGVQMETTTPISFTSLSQINSAVIVLNITEPPNICVGGVEPNLEVQMYHGSTLIGFTQLGTSGNMSATSPSIPLTNILISGNTIEVGEYYEFRLISEDGRGELTLTVSNPELTNLIIGGLRIKEIRSYDGLSHVNDIIKTYDYSMSDTSVLSSGVLLSSPVYATSALSVDIGDCLSGADINILEWRSFPITNLSQYEGRHIVYRRVVETVAGMGSTEYKFNSDPNPFSTPTAIALPQGVVYPSGTHFNFVIPPRVYNFANGELLSKKMYDTSQNLVRSEIYERSDSAGYSESPSVIFKSKCFGKCVLSGGGLMPEQFTATARGYSPRAGWYLLGKKTTIQDGVITIDDYTYSPSAGHYSPITQTITNSDGLAHITMYSYPADYKIDESAAIGDTMINKNLILPAWKTEHFITDTTESNRVDGKKVTWKNFSGTIYPEYGYRWEMTFDSTGADVPGADWDQQYRISAYDTSVGRIKRMRLRHWPFDNLYTYTSSGQLLTDTYGVYIKRYEYEPSTDLISKSINIDSTSSSYKYDALIRPYTIIDDQRQTTTSIDYHYSTGATDRSFTQVSTHYPALGSTNRTLIDRTFYDGLGRTIEVNKQAQGPTAGESIIISQTYDPQGRVEKTYEPRAVNNTDLDYEGASGDYTLTSYEASPLSRVLSRTSPETWMTNTMTYSMNSANEVTGYPAGSLFKITDTDANNNRTETFTNRLGLSILSRSFDGAIEHSTYTSYDKKNRPITIRPPGADPGDSDLIFTKSYAGNDLLVEEHIPGRGVTKYINSKRGELIYKQDPLMKAQRDSLYYSYYYDSYGNLQFEGWTDNNIPKNDVSSQGNTVVVCGSHQYGTTGRSKGKIIRSGYDLVSTLSIPSSTGGNNPRFTSHMSYNNAGLLAHKEYNTFLSPNPRSLKEYYEYDSADNLINTRSDHTAITTHPIEYNFTTEIDHAGRILSKWFGQGATTHQNKLCSYRYTAKDQVNTLTIGDAVETINYDYLSNQLLSAQVSPSFSSTLYYNDTSVNNQQARLNGDISSWSWTVNGSSHHYNFMYDGLNRLKQAHHNGSTTNAYNTAYTYDKRGNIETLIRRGDTPAIIDALAYDYTTGNQLNHIEDNASAGFINDGFNGDVGDQKSYTYDANGNVTVDESRSTTTRYNHMNLPYDIENNNDSSTTIRYEYDFSGTLHRISNTIAGTMSHTDYIGPVEYIDGQIKRINHDHGFIEMGPVSGPYVFLNGTQNADIDENWDVIESDELIKVGNDVNYWGVDCIVLQDEFEVEPGAEFLADFKPYGKETHYWTVVDHQNSVRTIFDDNGTVQQEFSYYPFGMRWDYNDSPSYEWNRSGALEQDGIAKHLDVMAFRVCDRTIGRFTSVDPLSDAYSFQSSYAFAANNPIYNVDFLGLAATSAQDLVEDVWSQGDGTYDNAGNRIEASDDNEDCCPTGLGIYNLTKSRSIQEGIDINEAYEQELSAMGEGNSMVLKETALLFGGGLLFKGGKLLYALYKAKHAIRATNKLTTVGRWMSKAEYETILKSGRMIEGAGGQTFVATGGSGSFTGAASGSVYVEFQIAAKNLLQGGKSIWFKTLGPNASRSQLRALEKQGGELLPHIFNILLK